MTRYTVSPPMLIEKGDREKPYKKDYANKSGFIYDMSDYNRAVASYEAHLSSLQQIRMSDELLKWCEEKGIKEVSSEQIEVKSDCCGRCDGVNDICNGEQFAYPVRERGIIITQTFPPSGKIKVTPEESVIVQERLFKEGYRWMKAPKTNYLKMVNDHYIFWYKDGYMTWCWPYEENEHENPEYTMSLFAPVEVVDEWDKAYNDFKETTEYSYCLPLNLYSTFINYLKSHYKIIKL